MSIDNHELHLVWRTLDGDQDAFGTLIVMYERSLLTYIYSLLRDWENARDVAQETFTAAYYALPHWKPPASHVSQPSQTSSLDASHYVENHPLAPWLYRIATNKALNFLKKQIHREQASLQGLKTSRSETHTVEESYLIKELLQEVLHSLSEDDALCIILRFGFDESYGEIAQKINLSTEAVRKRIARGLITLRATYFRMEDQEVLLIRKQKD